jgi:hypothetical protein
MTGEAEPSALSEADDVIFPSFQWVKIDGERNVSWELRGSDGIVIASVSYKGHRRWRGSYSFANRHSWCEVGTTLRARRWIEDRLAHLWEWDGCTISNSAEGRASNGN